MTTEKQKSNLQVDGRRREVVSGCPFGAAVCSDRLRQARGECLECWGGALQERAARSEWLRTDEFQI